MTRNADNLEYLARLGRLLRQKREAAGLTLEQVANIIGVSTTQVNRLEHAGIGNPSHEDIMALADLYGLDVKTLRGHVAAPPLPEKRADLVSSIETLVRYLTDDASDDQLEYVLTFLQMVNAHRRLSNV